ncbi:Dyslexia susceptibility 1 candidate gene 1 protein-like [Papilio xuthus]|uniref:Dyslexia susceptibility 1 candidate gene 1 protein-like n=1 Tax=Papilio xuthus TaxID=66420 RepID=A0A194PV34_PAPXU|nr:Dyslexia susceptibility 1 candidate gene 1 protein-like [Papilio xuthus]
MPILVKDFTWTQSPTNLQIKIPSKSMNKNNIDVFTTDSYIKIHFNPFLFEIFLLHDVDNERSKCIVQEESIVLELIKKKENDWECLEKCLTKEEKKELRQKILEKCQDEAKEKTEQKSLKKSEMDRFTVQKAMEIDSQQHALMDSRRDAERNKAMNELQQWNDSLKPLNPNINASKHINSNWSYNIKKNENSVKIVELPSSDDEKNENKTKKQTTQKKPAVNKTLASNISKPVRSEYVEKMKKETANRVLPKLRETGEVVITHTPRTFPTPSRESAAQEEEAWLKNITQARRAIGFVSEDLRPEEHDPQWCKEKGDEFFRNGNFLGAISAYSHGITLSNKLPTLYSNRAAAHFALGNFNKCVNDTSTALDLLNPPCEGNRKSRAKCIARRAAALVRLGYLNKAIGEMKAAAKLMPEDENIKKDIYNMEKAWEQNPDSD